ncbi:MAG: hypothetical protein HYW89_03545 [Candidatus Sungiibacteriota bacterium]|uniref:PD-(D/E)XK endonuclease-like domain-containing protein n=1 Tax=Candidatus Sungiibacteriota bacterium TaxID=2750080 RepID=A0A7T5RIZ7_9BACT|nr:MAG: hypothetical protein HYW89_03545 [Candidatus Sungbacteria bacterium]
MWYSNAEQFKGLNGYVINGVWYPRVTKILDVKAKPALDNFLREMENYASAEDVKNRSAAEGSLVHDIIEKLMVGSIVEVPPEIKPAVETFQRFNEERKIVFQPDFVERQILSLQHRYAGTVDALALVDGKFGVLDIKTSTGFYPEYNLQTAAYVSALQEFEVKRNFMLPRDIETRWILRINQHRICNRCGATLREKGGRSKVRNGKNRSGSCPDENHEWGSMVGDVELREFPYFYKDIKAFMAAKILWEWENDYWLRQIKYI